MRKLDKPVAEKTLSRGPGLTLPLVNFQSNNVTLVTKGESFVMNIHLVHYSDFVEKFYLNCISNKGSCMGPSSDRITTIYLLREKDIIPLKVTEIEQKKQTVFNKKCYAYKSFL